MSTERSIHRIASLFGLVKAARRGPASLGRRVVRAQAHKQLARAMRRTKLGRP